MARLMLKAKVMMPDGERIAVREGTAQGGPLSPILSNIVLDELDQELARRGPRFARYADDCNIFVGGRRAGERDMASTTAYLEKRMRLRVNAEKSAARTLGEGHFLGFFFRRPNDADDHIEVGLSKKAAKRLLSRS